MKKILVPFYNFLDRQPRIERPKVIMTVLVRDEADIINQHLSYHINMGIDGFIVTDNRSRDGTREILENHKKSGHILELIDEPSEAFDQTAWVHRMIELARDKYGADYCINSDADEFWYTASGSLSDELSKSRASKIRCPSYNMLPTSEGEFWTSTDCVKRALPKNFRLNGYNLLFNKPTDKVIHRTQNYRMIKPGNHGVEMADRTSEKSRTIQIYHYSIRSKEQFIKKMQQSGAALESNKNSTEKEGVHWRYFYRGEKSGILDLDQEFYKVIGIHQLPELRRVGCVVTDPTMARFFNKMQDPLPFVGEGSVDTDSQAAAGA